MLVPAALLASPATPPRGWNSYDSYTMNVNETEFLANCAAMAELLLPHGFDTCVIDYLWYESGGIWSLDDYCRPIPAVERWPSSAGGKGFRPIADKIHAMGLRFGIHIMRGTSSYAQEKNCVVKNTTDTRIADIVDTGSDATCPWKPDSVGVDMKAAGAQAFYDSLYEQYSVDWQVDFIKNGSARHPPPRPLRARRLVAAAADCVFRSKRVDEIHAQAASIRKFSAAPGRPIVYSLSPGSSPGEPGFEGEPALADQVRDVVNMYRITDDDWDHWGALSVHFEAAAVFASRIGAPGLLGGGSFPDLDMLPIGYVTEPGDSHVRPDHWSRLTRDEQRSQVTLWSVARSPLFLGGDVTRLLDQGNANATFVLSLLTNRAVLQLNSRSTDNREALHDGPLRVWAAALGGRTFAAAFFNTGGTAMTTAAIKVSDVLGAGAAGVRSCNTTDMWSGASRGPVAASSQLVVDDVAAHATVLLQLDCET